MRPAKGRYPLLLCRTLAIGQADQEIQTIARRGEVVAGRRHRIGRHPCAEVDRPHRFLPHMSCAEDTVSVSVPSGATWFHVHRGITLGQRVNATFSVSFIIRVSVSSRVCDTFKCGC